MKFIVIDKRNGKDITKDYFWVFTSDGCSKCKYSDDCQLHLLTCMCVQGEEKFDGI